VAARAEQAAAATATQATLELSVTNLRAVRERGSGRSSDGGNGSHVVLEQLVAFRRSCRSMSA